MIFKCRKASERTNDLGEYAYKDVEINGIEELYDYLIQNGNGCESVILRFNHNPNEWVLDCELDEEKINELIIYDDYVE